MPMVDLELLVAEVEILVILLEGQGRLVKVTLEVMEVDHLKLELLVVEQLLLVDPLLHFLVEVLVQLLLLVDLQ